MPQTRCTTKTPPATDKPCFLVSQAEGPDEEAAVRELESYREKLRGGQVLRTRYEALRRGWEDPCTTANVTLPWAFIFLCHRSGNWGTGYTKKPSQEEGSHVVPKTHRLVSKTRQVPLSLPVSSVFCSIRVAHGSKNA